MLYWSLSSRYSPPKVTLLLPEAKPGGLMPHWKIARLAPASASLFFSLRGLGLLNRRGPAHTFQVPQLRGLARGESGRVCQRVLMIANMLEGDGACQGEPTSRPQYAHRLGEIARREDAEDEIERGILHRLLGPQIGDREGQAGGSGARPGVLRH